jgi:hypothetical protein
MPGSPLTGQGGQFGGPQFGWGDTPGGGAHSANSGQNRGRYTNSSEAGLHVGEWQWRGHGPSAQQSYGWDYQGGVGRDEITQRTEARMGSSFQARMAQERSGGLPQGRYAIDYDQGRRTGGGGMQGAQSRYGAANQRYGGDDSAGGMEDGGAQSRYGGDYSAGGIQGGGMQGRGTVQRFSARDVRPGGGYGGDYRGGYGGPAAGHGGGNPQGGDASGGYGRGRGFGGGMRAGGAGARGYDRGMRGAMGGRYGARYGGDYTRPLGDADFYRRVERW